MIYSFCGILQLALQDFVSPIVKAHSLQFLLCFSICPWVRLLLANFCNKWKFWSCSWQLCIRWTALDYVTHDVGPQSLKSNFYHKISSKLKNW